MTSAVAGATRTAAATTGGSAGSTAATATGAAATAAATRAPAPAPARARTRVPGRVETVGQSAAGLVLGLLVWGWVILPLVRGGPDEVRAMIRAKFTNKDRDGRWLP